MGKQAKASAAGPCSKKEKGICQKKTLVPKEGVQSTAKGTRSPEGGGGSKRRSPSEHLLEIGSAERGECILKKEIRDLEEKV